MITINFKFNSRSESISFQESVPISIIDFISQASALFGVESESVQLFQEIPDTGELNLIDSDDALTEVLDSSFFVLKTSTPQEDESKSREVKYDNESDGTSVLTFRLVEKVHKEEKERTFRKQCKGKERFQKQNQKQKQKKDREEWMTKRKREAFEEASKYLNHEYGTNTCANDLKTIFECLNIRPFRLVRRGILPKGYFQFKNEVNQKGNTTEDTSMQSMNQNDDIQSEMCHHFHNSLAIEDHHHHHHQQQPAKTKTEKPHPHCKRMKKSHQKMMQRHHQCPISPPFHPPFHFYSPFYPHPMLPGHPSFHHLPPNSNCPIKHPKKHRHHHHRHRHHHRRFPSV